MKHLLLALGLLTGGPLVAQIPTNGLLTHYSFSGNANDESGNNQHGTVYGATLTADRFGNLSSAYNFNGINTYIQVPETLLVGLNTYSFSIWARPTADPTNYGGLIYSVGDMYQNQDQTVTYRTTSDFFAGSYNTGNIMPFQSKAGSQPMPPGQWVHLVVVRDTVDIKLYLNGALLPPLPDRLTHNQPAAYGSPTRAIIGARSNLNSIFDTFFNGDIDDLRHYNRGLSQNEVTALYYESVTGNRITGNTFRDLNANGIQDSTDYAMQNMVLQVDSAGVTSGYSSSNTAGFYTSYTRQGNYTVSVPQTPLYHTFSPVSHTATFTGLGEVDSLNHFALAPIPNMNDLRATLTSYFPPRPGFNSTFLITYKNVGTTTLSGQVSFVPDTLFSFISVTDSAAISSDTLVWSFSDLAPGQFANIQTVYRLDSTAVLGDTVHCVAMVNPLSGDQAPADNSDILSEIIIGSYDPNDKAVIPEGNITPQQVTAAQPLVYTIRFQNTGTAEAVNVAITDTLSQQLRIPTIEILSASHPYTFEIRNNQIKWRFDNIMLPDSNTNEPASHGFVKYRVLPKETLQLGDKIENTAYIYFDFNAPVITNTTVTEVTLLSNIPANQNQLAEVVAYPNPGSGLFFIKVNSAENTAIAAKLMNALGQEAKAAVKKDSEAGLIHINLNAYPEGIYFLRVSVGGQARTIKLVLQK